MKKRIASAQYAPAMGDVASNLEIIQKLASDAVEAGADLVVFPELATTGYMSAEKIIPLAEPLPGPTFERLCAMARELNVALALGFIEKDEEPDCLYNTMFLVDADGKEVLRYRKVHLWDTERAWAKPGTAFTVGLWQQVPVGMWICCDSRFPEAARSIAVGGGKLALVATAWLGPALEWELAIHSRAMDNGIFVAGSAFLGESLHGTSLIVDPHGSVIAQGREGEDMVVMATIDLADADKFLNRVPLLDRRCPDAYRA